MLVTTLRGYNIFLSLTDRLNYPQTMKKMDLSAFANSVVLAYLSREFPCPDTFGPFSCLHPHAVPQYSLDIQGSPALQGVGELNSCKRGLHGVTREPLS
jgi:hypothetical protein